MSARDQRLIDAAGLSAVEVGLLLRRSRQAIYTGLSREGDYFEAAQIALFLNELRRRNSEQIDSFIAFVEAHYGPKPGGLEKRDEREIILPNRVGSRQVLRAAESAGTVIAACNENLEHFSPAAAFSKVIGDLLLWHRLKLDLIIPAKWMKDYITDKYKLPIPEKCRIASVVDMPVVISSSQSSARGFFFGSRSLEEMHSADAKALEIRLSKVP
jgi:hypothetical protein